MAEMLVRLKEVTKRYENRLVLKSVSFRMAAGERVALIGRNGSGKTTLLNLILRQEDPDEGQIDVPPDVRIGYFSQFSTLDGDASVEQVLEQTLHECVALERELQQIETRLVDAPEGELEGLLDRQAHVIHEMDRLGAWTWRNRADTVLTRLSFSQEHRRMPISQLSGGWRNRAALARLLLEQPDVLLLDEPTNYLDVQGIAWLEDWFGDFRGALLLVCHDRHFIDRIATRIVEIDAYHLQDYPGDYALYVAQRKLRLKTIQNQFEFEEEMLAYESEAITDRAEARRDPYRALRRKLANISKRADPRPADRIITTLYANLRVGASLCEFRGLTKSIDGRTLFTGVGLHITKGDRVAIVGPNGCGKSTLLRVLTRREPPDTGQVDWASGQGFADFNKVLAELDPDDTVTHTVNVEGLAYIAPRKQVNRFLNLLGFSEMDLTQRIGSLSGGQRARVALALCLLSGASVLVLDEPTNHLDIQSAQIMERALEYFPGAVIVVSHDRFFIDKVATRMLIFTGNGTVRTFDGNWSMYEASGKDG
jgi:ATP-binding cassette subfamily F protein 3